MQEAVVQQNPADVSTKPVRVTSKLDEVKHARPGSLNLAEYEFVTFSYVAPAGDKIEDLMKREYWRNEAYKLRKDSLTNTPDKTGAVIVVRTVDHSYYAELYVRAVHEKDLVVQQLRYIPLGTKTGVDTTGFDKSWNVGKRGWDVIRLSDREIVADGKDLKTQEEADEWIAKTKGAI